MHDSLRVLLSLQEVDSDLFRVRSELKRLPRERDRALAGLEALQEKKRVLDRRLLDLKTRVKEIDDDTTLQRQRMRKVESEAMRSRGDVALQAAFQHEARSLKRDISSAEEEGLRMVEETEEVERQVGDLGKLIEEEQATYDALAENVAKEIEEAETRAATMEAERQTRLSSELNSEVVTKYEKLLEVREGQALAILEDRICQGCYMEVPPNLYVRVARGTELVQCPACQRFLYLLGS